MAKASKKSHSALRKPHPKPKLRKVWAINPKTRVKPSAKIYDRAKEKQKARGAVSQIDWFGEGE